MIEFEARIETIIDECTKVMKKKYKNTLLYRKLQRHEAVGNFNCWRELSVYQLGKWIKDNLNIPVEVNLEGKKSNLVLEVTDQEFQILNTRLINVLKTVGDS